MSAPINLTDIDIEKIWAVSWSEKQQCFHIETLDEYICANLRMYAVKFDPQYSMIAMCDTNEQAHALCRRLARPGYKGPIERFQEMIDKGLEP